MIPPRLKPVVLACTVSGLAALPSAACAEVVASELGVIEVVGRTSGPGTATRHVIDSDELSARGAQTLDEALQLVPGLNVRAGGEGVPRIDIRGQRTRHIKLLIDGVPFNGSGDGQFDPALIPMALIDSIVVTTGGSSVLYGEGGTAGVIEIITRSGRGPWSGRVGALKGNGGRWSVDGQVGGGAGPWTLSLGAQRAMQDGFPISDDTRRTSVQRSRLRTNSDLERSNVYANLGLQATDAMRFGLQVAATEAGRGSPPSVIDRSDDVFAQARPNYSRIDNIRSLRVCENTP